MLAIVKPLMATALTGLLVTAVLHGLTISGLAPLDLLAIPLFVGIVIVWIPLNLILFKIRFPDYDLLDGEWEWTSLFRGSPVWLNGLCVLLFVYMLLVSEPGRESAILMFFYAVALSVLYSVNRQPWLLVGLVCPNDHKVSLVNRFCPTCGACLPKR